MVFLLKPNPLKTFKVTRGHPKVKVWETIPLWPKCDGIPHTGSKIGAGTDQNGRFFDNNWPPSWMRHSTRTDWWTRVSTNRKKAIWSISAQFYHMAERYERVRVGCHCTEIKIEKSRVKTSSYHSPKLHHSNPNSFGANVHLRQIKKKTVKVIERSRDVTPR